MNLANFAEAELKAAGYLDDNSDYDGALGRAVLEMIKAFEEQGHSGASAGIAIGLFERLANFMPLTPLTGQDDEWMEVGAGLFQNRRYSAVFKGADGAAYDIEGRIFREPDGCCYTGRDSRVPVTFPYTPKRAYVDRPCTDAD